MIDMIHLAFDQRGLSDGGDKSTDIYVTIWGGAVIEILEVEQSMLAP
jgi:hypothetical protein